MPPKYVRKGTKGRMDRPAIEGAMKAVREQGISISAAQEVWNTKDYTVLVSSCKTHDNLFK